MWLSRDWYWLLVKKSYFTHYPRRCRFWCQFVLRLGVYTIPLPAHQRAAVEKLSGLVTNGDEFGSDAEGTTKEAVTLQ